MPEALQKVNTGLQHEMQHKKKSLKIKDFLMNRSGGIRTRDLRLPKTAL